MREVAALLHDTHADVTHPLSGFMPPYTLSSVPLRLGWFEDRLIVVRVDTADAALGVSAGDEILSVDGRSVADIDREQRRLYSTSHVIPHAPILHLLGARDSRVRLEIRTRSGVRQLDLPRSRSFRAVYDDLPFVHPRFTVLPGNIGYIDLGRTTSAALFDTAMTALAETRGLIIDGQSGAASSGQLNLFRFITEPAQFIRRVESVSYLHGTEMPSRGFVSPQTWTIPIPPAACPYPKPLVIIIGLGNSSRGESLAKWMTLAHRATFVGTATNGTYGTKDGVTLPGGAVFHFTAGRALWPDGTRYHRVGVVPDVTVNRTVRGFREGRDEVFDVALETMQRLLRQPRR